MRLFRTTLILGIGYALGRPAVRQGLIAMAGRIRGLAPHPDSVELADRRWTPQAGTLHLPQQLRPDGRSGHPSSGLQWPPTRRFPRHAASPRPDDLIPPAQSSPRPSTYLAPPLVTTPRESRSSCSPTAGRDASARVVAPHDRDLSMPGHDRGETT
jgi:hypothetical protein